MRSIIENLERHYNTLHVVNVINIINKSRHWCILFCKEALLIDIIKPALNYETKTSKE